MTNSPHDDHTAAMMAAFAKVLAAEEAIRVAKVEQSEAMTLLGLKVATSETALAEAWKSIEQLMNESGEFEVLLPGTATDYRIGYSTPRLSAKVESPDAVPDEFVKIERKPKLKEIGDYLKGLPAESLPNWARLEAGERKLGWKSIKKGTL
jgi:hypothetical protein